MILMRRPRNCGPSERTPMGDLIDFKNRLPSTGGVCVCVNSYTLTSRRNDMQDTTTIYPCMYM